MIVAVIKSMKIPMQPRRKSLGKGQRPSDLRGTVKGSKMVMQMEMKQKKMMKVKL